MSVRFKTADELMDHLRKQIVSHYKNGDEGFIELNSQQMNQKCMVDITSFKNTLQESNSLWNVTADRPLISHRKYVGRVIVFAKKVVRKLLRWYVSQTFDMQTTFNGSMVRTLNELNNVLINMNAKLEEQGVKITEQENLIREQGEKITEQENLIREQGEKITKQENLIREQGEKITKQENLIQEQSAKITEQEDQIQEQKISAYNMIDELRTWLHGIAKENEMLNNDMNTLHYRLRRLKKEGKSNGLVQNEKNTVSKEVTSISVNEKEELQLEGCFDYLLFENRFRGTVKEIKERQKMYLPYFINQNNVLDFGCGRGEFIELLLENNISVFGIDLNEDMVEYCQERGLPVKYGDALEYLHSIGDGELGGIFVGQVVEHISFEQIVTLVNVAFQKLKPGAYLIMETPNPLTLAIFYLTFYLDPTHIKPIHPRTLRFVTEAAGFTDVKVSYSGRVEEESWIPKLEATDTTIKNLEQYNKSIDKVNELLFGHLDYAIIAKK